MSNRLQDKVIVITGATGGIGSATVERCLREGAKVAVVDLPGDTFDSAMARFEEIGGDVLAAPADVSQESAFQGAFDLVAERFGGVDGLFNNAGIEGEVSSFETCPVELFDRVLAVNTRGVFLC